MTRIPAPADLTNTIANRAMQNARRDIVKRGWKSATALRPYATEGSVGITSTVNHLLIQNKGFDPFVMWWVKNRVVPLGCKAQPLDAKVLTPTGWKEMGEILVGDAVVDPCGQVSHVTQVFPQGYREIFRVTLADGSQTRATADHLWTLDDGSVCTTEEIKTRTDALSLMPAQSRRTLGRPHKSRWYPRVPPITPVLYQDGPPLPIPAYTLGALLGDGDMSDRKLLFHSADKEIVCRIESELPETLGIKHIDGYRYHIRLTNRHVTGRVPSHPYIIALKDLGLHGHACYTKFIPDVYKTASLEDRIELLRGLFDTDGSCSTLGSVSFYTSSKRLADDVRDVLRSIGARCSLISRDSTNFSARQKEMGKFNGKISWVLSVNSPTNLFFLNRKSERFRVKNDTRFRRIISVESTGIAPAQCIRVSADSSLYVTDDFVPTHNSGDGPHFRNGSGVGTPGMVDIPHKGKVWRPVRWRHPGLQPKRFMETAVTQAIKDSKADIRKSVMMILRGGR